MRRFCAFAAGATLLGGLAGCSSSTTATVDAVRYLIAPPPADTAQLNPDLRYIRVTSDKNVALMALGYVDDSPQAGTEVWYSADKETLRLWQGRIAGTAGLKTDWRSVRFQSVPSWRSALTGPVRWQRVRDVMPGYATDVREDVQLRAIAPPANSRLRNLRAESLQWFEETTLPQGLAAGLPPARFAVDLSQGAGQVVYSEQCLDASLCLSTQAWPAVPPTRPPTSAL